MLPAPTANNSYKLYSINDFLKMKGDSNHWIVPDMIPKAGRVLVYGKGGDYKSSLIFDLCLAVASGGKLLERLAVIKAYGPVILLSTEGSVYTNRDRLIAYMRSRNVVPEMVNLHYGQQPLELRQDDQAEVLLKMIQTIQPIMLVLDPMVSFYGGNENDTEQMSKFVNRLNRMIVDYNVTVVIIHHANKLGEMRGSTVLQGWADSIIKFVASKAVTIPGFTDKKDVICVTSEKQRDGRTGPLFSAVPFFGNEVGMVTFGIYDVMDQRGVLTTHLKHAILKHLQTCGDVLTRSELATQLHATPARVDEALEWLEMYDLVEKEEAKRSTGVMRSTGTNRMRPVNGWKAIGIGSRVDAAHAIVIASVERGVDANLQESY